MKARGWDHVDIILVTGDAYVDHPSFGIALIGRLLEAQGYRVAVLSQPRYDTADSFRVFGPPRLFWGISSGNLDSIVANYSSNRKVRDQDSYSPGGNPYFDREKVKKERRRPDRATLLYANLARRAFTDKTPIILGGLEASLRRFVHYDYQQKKLRSSVLTDAKADLLIYGMGERAVLEAAERLAKGNDLTDIPGTCLRLTDREMADLEIPSEKLITLPSWQKINREPESFLETELRIDKQARASDHHVLSQHQQAMWIIQNPPAAPLTSGELDRLYALPFTRKPHPEFGEVPAWRMIRNSLTIVRGCCGNCSFCGISRHQGAAVTYRSEKSILQEIQKIAEDNDFDGTITDLGGPTANLYGVKCRKGGCKSRDCLYEKICPHLNIEEEIFISLLKQAVRINKVKHVFISSGLRMEIMLQTPRLLKEIILKHTPGVLKIAPEHTESHILSLMHKPDIEIMEDFLALCRRIGKENNRKVHLTPYLISSHPGCTVDDMKQMVRKIKAAGLKVKQFQDFTPTPGTISTAMYVAGLGRNDLRPIHIPRGDKERREQRQTLEKCLPGQ